MPTLLVNPERCTRCGRCSMVCPMGIIAPASRDTLPFVADEAAERCIRCGHCEVFCPASALLLNDRPDEKSPVPAGAGELPPDKLAVYLKKRRSIRHFTKDPVPRENILALLDIARYAASGGNGQPVQWLVIHDPRKVREISGLVIEWMRQLDAGHPLGNYLPSLIAGWEAGYDVICRGAPHLLVAHVPKGNPIAPTDAIIALTYVDVAAPAMNIGTCWAGFIGAAMAAGHPPLLQAFDLPPDRIPVYAMMLGTPRFKAAGLPRRNPLSISWQ